MGSSSTHADLTSNNIHRPYRQVFANAAARTGDSTTYTNNDLYKKALQIDTGAEYYLTSASPVVWTAIAQALPSITANNNVMCLDRMVVLLTTEEVTGGTVLDGSKIISSAYFRLIGVLTSATGSGLLRLYDLGPESGPPVTPVLRSTLTIPNTDNGDVVVKTTALTPVAAPTLPDEIYNTARVYELRAYVNSAVPGDSLRLLQAALVTYFY